MFKQSPRPSLRNSSMKTLILDNFDSFTFNLYQYCAELNGNPAVYRNNNISLKKIKRENFTHIIISPGPGSPLNKKDFGICETVIKNFAGKLPILGICLGHQGIIHALGGKIIRAKVPMHGKKCEIKIQNKSRLFQNLPEKIYGMRYHSLMGERESLPNDLKITAETKDKIVMAIEHKDFPLYGLQFHPESIGTDFGRDILKNFLNEKINTEQFINDIESGRLPDEKIEETLKNMAEKGETIDEILGIIKGLQKYAVKIKTGNQLCMDNCGTGGSGLQRMNISTTAAFVLAACGVKIAKHGNRAASGRCGSFDLLERLGINIELTPEKIAEAIKKLGIGFLYAPLFHPVMKKIAPIRKKLGIPTIFNIIGPLLNPTKPAYHLLGASSEKIAEKIAQVMQKMNYKHAVVVTGEDGLDEVTLTGKTTIYEIKNGKFKKYEFDPKEVGMEKVSFKKIQGGMVEENALIFLALLKNQAPKDLQNLLLLNCAFGLLTAEKVKTIKQGIEMADTAIKSGQAYRKFQEYRKFSNA